MTQNVNIVHGQIVWLVYCPSTTTRLLVKGHVCSLEHEEVLNTRGWYGNLKQLCSLTVYIVIVEFHLIVLLLLLYILPYNINTIEAFLLYKVNSVNEQYLYVIYLYFSNISFQ